VASKPVTPNPLCSHLAVDIEFPCTYKIIFTMQITKRLTEGTFMYSLHCIKMFLALVLAKETPEKYNLQRLSYFSFCDCFSECHLNDTFWLKDSYSQEVQSTTLADLLVIMQQHIAKIFQIVILYILGS